MFKSLAVAAALLTLPAVALAQNGAPPNPTGFSGVVVSAANDKVVLKTKDGMQTTIAMTPGWTVSTNRPTTADAIKAGDFVATTNTNIDANTGRSTELRILEPGYEPEHGTHAFPTPNTSITHGRVKTSTKTAAGQELDIVYDGGQRHIIVGPDIKVTASDLHPRSDAKPGVMVSGVTRKDDKGMAYAGRLQISQ
jgi:hypothetical protein